MEKVNKDNYEMTGSQCKREWFFVTLYVACGGAETVCNVKILVSDRFEGRSRVF